MRRTSGDFAPGIEVQQLYRHLLDCRSGLVALRSPSFSAEGVEPRRRCVGGDIGRRSIALDLIDAVQRNIEPIAALVFDDGDFDCALAHEDLLHTPIDPDAVLEVHDIVAGLERGEALECAAGGVASGAAKAALAAEDFVVGENAVSREFTARGGDEPSIENADRQAGRRDAIVVEQLVETLGLAGVVAENQGRDSVCRDLLQTLDVALNLLRLAERKHQRRLVAGEIDRAVRSERAQSLFGRLEQLVAAGCVLAAPTREVDVMLCFSPRPLELGFHMRTARNDKERVGRKQCPYRRSLRLHVPGFDLPIDWKNQRQLGVPG